MLSQYISIVHKSVLDQRVLTYNQIKFSIADNWFMVNLFYYPEQILWYITKVNFILHNT